MAEQTEQLSVRERIERRLLATLVAAQPAWIAEDLAAGRLTQRQADAITCERWDVRGTNSTAHGSICLFIDADEVQPGPDSDFSITHNLMHVVVMCFVAPPDKAAQVPATERNRILARIEKALMEQAPNLRDPQNPTDWLTVDMNVRERSAQELIDDNHSLVVALMLEVQYRHPRTDPYTVSG